MLSSSIARCGVSMSPSDLPEWLTSLTWGEWRSSKPSRRRKEPTRSPSTIVRTRSTPCYLPPTERLYFKTTDICGVVSDGSARDVYGSRRKRCEDVRRQCNDRSEERRAALP